jgi:hypothetical protein
MSTAGASEKISCLERPFLLDCGSSLDGGTILAQRRVRDDAYVDAGELLKKTHQE